MRDKKTSKDPDTENKTHDKHIKARTQKGRDEKNVRPDKYVYINQLALINFKWCRLNVSLVPDKTGFVLLHQFFFVHVLI